MNIDEMVRQGRPRSAGWARSEAGRRVLDDVIEAAPAGDAAGRAVAGHSASSRPVLRWSLLGSGLVGAVAAVALAVSAISAPPDARDGTPPVAGEQTTARGILLAAADQAERAPAETGKYWHVKTLDVAGPQRVGSDQGGYLVLRRTINETWDAGDPRQARWYGYRDAGVRPRSDADERAWRAAGAPTEWTINGDGSKLVLSTKPGKGSLFKDTERSRYLEALGQLTLQQVRQLPEEQDALRTWVTSRVQAQMGFTPGSTASNRSVFGLLGQLLLDTPALPAVRAAAFRVLAGIPGVRSLGTLRDESGRTGLGVEFSDGVTTERLIVDGKTHLLLATNFTSTPPGEPAPVKEGSTVVLVAEWSDAAPQVPTLPRK